jgi:hypothetical protein
LFVVDALPEVENRWRRACGNREAASGADHVVHLRELVRVRLARVLGKPLRREVVRRRAGEALAVDVQRHATDQVRALGERSDAVPERQPRPECELMQTGFKDTDGQRKPP